VKPHEDKVMTSVGGTNYMTYLLTWNPSKSGWISVQEDWENFYSGNRPRLEWSCGNTRKIRVGDRVFLMRLGWREKVTGIVASGWVTGEPLEGQHWADDRGSALYIEFEPDVFLNPEAEGLLDPKVVSRDFNWHPQRSGVTIPNEIAAQLEKVWLLYHQRINLLESPSSNEEVASRIFIEGLRKPILGYRYERDPHARSATILHYGAQCTICGFDFGKTFGAIGEGFIHVHHLKPISEYSAEYTVDPIKDLRPVCPNCHAMLHRRSPPYTIEELQSIRQQASGMKDSRIK
jgi:5-methylcytosine-specific restriction protein A